MYKTEIFSPIGRVLIYGEYREDTKELTFKMAEGYFYPSDSQTTYELIEADKWMAKNNSKHDSLEDANEYLLSIYIKHQLY
ncbi:hypothetical protein [Rossellomorea marisflavi]|uniref:hypothetical protein n=1 Tax=Rossellomorea marisflavi TaxID=189381 RepID=UPI003F9F6D69